MILLTLSRGKGEETVRLQLPASPAEIGETFAFLDRISLDTTATAILDVSSNVPVLYRCLYDVDVEDSEQFQKLQKLEERTEALSPAKAAIFSGALDAECVWNLEGALTVADRLDEYMLVNNVSSDSELGIYLVVKGLAGLVVLKLGIPQCGEQAVFLTVHYLLSGEYDINEVFPQGTGQSLLQKAQILLGLLLRHHAQGFVQIGNDLFTAVDIASINTADGAFFRAKTAPQLIDFFLVHFFLPRFVIGTVDNRR